MIAKRGIFYLLVSLGCLCLLQSTIGAVYAKTISVNSAMEGHALREEHIAAISSSSRLSLLRKPRPLGVDSLPRSQKATALAVDECVRRTGASGMF